LLEFFFFSVLSCLAFVSVFFPFPNFFSVFFSLLLQRREWKRKAEARRKRNRLFCGGAKRKQKKGTKTEECARMRKNAGWCLWRIFLKVCCVCVCVVTIELLSDVIALFFVLYITVILFTRQWRIFLFLTVFMLLFFVHSFPHPPLFSLFSFFIIIILSVCRVA